MKSRLLFATLALAGASLAVAQTDPGYSQFNYSDVYVVNTTDRSQYDLPGNGGGDGHSSHDAATASFMGMDRSGNAQTMAFSGGCATSTVNGLHVVTTGTLTNSYYNSSNPLYRPADDTHPASGSPDSLVSLGFAGFSDTLQYGGALQDGYQARYVFHIDGTNSGRGSAADLGVNVGSDNDAFFDFDPGSIDTTFATKGFAVNGQTPQAITVQFSDQVVFDLFDNPRDGTLPDGSNLDSTSDFADTATFVGIELVDANGNVVPTSQWTVTAASGAHYAQLNAVPEPASLAALALGAFVAGRRTRRN